MKRLIAFVLCLAMLLPLAGCGEKSLQTPGNFYYYWPEALSSEVSRAPKQAIVAERRELAGISDDVAALLEAYLSGPERRELENLIPRDAVLLRWNLTSETLFLEFSKEFAALTGIELSLACACIATTFLELLPVHQVRIQAKGTLLDNASYIVLSADDLSMQDDAVDRLHTTLTVYRSDKQRRYLIGQEISINLATQDDIPALLVEELLKDPEDDNLTCPLPKGTKLLDVRLNGGLCTVDLSAEFETNAFSDCEAQRVTLMSVVNTLCQLESVDQVEFSVDGNLLVQYGMLNIPDALVWEDRVIGPVRTGVNEFDATLYLPNESEVYLTPVPSRIRQTFSISRAEQVVQALLDFQSVNCLSSAIPPDTRLISVSVVDGMCWVDLSKEFWEGNPNLSLSVHSIVASVCSLEEVDRVQITVEGTIPEGAADDNFLPLSPSPDWFV